MEQLNLQELIKEISPLYNSYKKTNRSISGLDALYIMWEIGDILKRKIEILKIAPHNLYRKIYGKAEGQSDIVQKSYITREFLGRAYRIRNIFSNKENIKKDLPNLNNFISFREAMPFFDNDKYILKGKEKENLLTILNSNESPNLILKKIKSLQKEKIGKKNSRNQKLDELQPQKEIFVIFYNYLFNFIKNNEYKEVVSGIKYFDGVVVSKLSSNTSALAQEGFKYVEILEENFDDKWVQYVNLLKNFSKQVDAKERRRFRRLISPERIVKLAEMLQAITSEDSFRIFKRGK
jgi:hypothetical protein